ncbi:MAG TPA: OmpA family protein [Polyangiaceae bacterium]|nr:OmpA family protein [Polyangiaceae bacterium]
MRLRSFMVAAAGLALALAARDALAQDATAADPFRGGFSLQQFDPSYAGDRFFGVQSPSSDQTYFGAQLIANYARKPLEVTSRFAGTDRNINFVEHQLYGHLNVTAGSTFFLFNADLPFALAQSGDAVPGLQAQVPQGGRVGDLRLGVRLTPVGGWQDPFALGLQFDTYVPTGDTGELTGDQRVRAHPRLAVGGKVGSFVYAANGGFLFRRFLDLGTPEIGDAITFGAGAGLLLARERVQIGPELYGNTVLPKNGSDTPFLGNHSTPLELLFGVKADLGGFLLGAAAGGGPTKALGTAELRAIATLGYALRPEPPQEAPPDRDGDGIADREDACPDKPGVRSADRYKNGCPADRDNDSIADAQDACPDVAGVPNPDRLKNGCPPDRDGDTIADAQDACPDVAGPRSDDPTKNGCPPDRDNDKIADAEDACPDTPGVRDQDPAKNGCPPDRDNDKIADAEDACPDTPGVRDADPKKNGCPPVVSIVGKEIKITEQVHFATNKATILPDSDNLLQQVADTIKEHPEIKFVSVEGHTDNVGKPAYNKQLSKSRADAVKTWLVKRGKVDPKRLFSVGYGDTKPIQTNDTPEGRQANRRVEFHILDEPPAKGGAQPKKKLGRARPPGSPRGARTRGRLARFVPAALPPGRLARAPLRPARVRLRPPRRVRPGHLDHLVGERPQLGPVRHHDHGATAPQGREQAVHAPGRRRVQVGRRLVQQEHRQPRRRRARQRHPRALAPRELPIDRAERLVGRPGRRPRPPQRLERRPRLARAHALGRQEVVGERAGDERRALRRPGEGALERPDAGALERTLAVAQPPARRLEAQQGPHERRLSRTRRPDDHHERARAHRHRPAGPVPPRPEALEPQRERRPPDEGPAPGLALGGRIGLDLGGRTDPGARPSARRRLEPGPQRLERRAAALPRRPRLEPVAEGPVGPEHEREKHDGVAEARRRGRPGAERDDEQDGRRREHLVQPRERRAQRRRRRRRPGELARVPPERAPERPARAVRAEEIDVAEDLVDPVRDARRAPERLGLAPAQAPSRAAEQHEQRRPERGEPEGEPGREAQGDGDDRQEVQQRPQPAEEPRRAPPLERRERRDEPRDRRLVGPPRPLPEQHPDEPLAVVEPDRGDEERLGVGERGGAEGLERGRAERREAQGRERPGRRPRGRHQRPQQARGRPREPGVTERQPERRRGEGQDEAPFPERHGPRNVDQTGGHSGASRSTRPPPLGLCSGAPLRELPRPVGFPSMPPGGLTARS